MIGRERGVSEREDDTIQQKPRVIGVTREELLQEKSHKSYQSSPLSMMIFIPPARTLPLPLPLPPFSSLSKTPPDVFCC